MRTDNVDYAKGETPMTDYQFKALMASISETQQLKDMLTNITSIFNTSKDLDEARERFNKVIGTDYTEKNSPTQIDTADYSKNESPIIEMIYQILKANFELGKTPEEILKSIAALKQ